MGEYSFAGLEGPVLEEHIMQMFRKGRLAIEAGCVFLVLRDHGGSTERRIPVLAEGYVNDGDMFPREVSGVIRQVVNTKNRSGY